MTTLHEFLNQFYNVDAGVVEKLWKLGVDRKYNKGDVMTHEGQVQRDFLWVEEGVQMSYLNHDGDIHVIAFTYPPSFSGIPESFLLQKPSLYELTALTESKVRAFSHQTLQLLCDQHRSLEKAFSRQTELLLEGVIKRHLERQTMTIEQRFKEFARRSPHLFQLGPHKYIANYLHINHTNFSKLFNQVKM